MEGSVSLLKHELVGAAQQNGDGFTLVGAAGDLDDLGRATSRLLNNEVSLAEHLGLQVVDVGDSSALDGSADEVDLASINVLDDHNLHFGEEVEGKLRNCLTEDALLEQQNICARFLNLLAQVDNVFLLFFEETVHGSVIMNNNIALEVGLGSGERELNESNLGISNSGWATGVVRGLLVDEAETINELRVVNSTAKFGGDVNVVQVSVVCGLLINNLQDGIDSDGGEQVRMVRHDLGAEGGDGVFNQLLAVIQIDWDRHIINNFQRLLEGNLETI